MLNVSALQVGYSSANNVLRILDGASLTTTAKHWCSRRGRSLTIRSTSAPAASLTPKAGIRVDDNINSFIIDGGTVTNSGSFYKLGG